MSLFEEILDSNSYVYVYGERDTILFSSLNRNKNEIFVIGKYYSTYFIITTTLRNILQKEDIVDSNQIQNLIKHNIELSIKEDVESLLKMGVKEKDILEVLNKICSEFTIKDIIC